MATVSHRVARHKIWPSDWLDTFHRVSKLLYLVNLGPRVFSDKAADEDPGKIHFIFPKFWGKKRMRSEAQRMLLIKNNAGAYYF